MKRLYRIPVTGGVKNDQPLQGIEGNPLTPIPLDELPGFPPSENDDSNYGYVVLDYNVDDEWCEIEVEASDAFHEWLLGLMPNLKNIAKGKGWKLDKTELEKTRKTRGEKGKK